jgi:hypothetical protein
MSVIPAQGSASSEQTAWDLGQLARSLYDQWKSDETDRFATQLAAEKRAKSLANMLSPSAQAVGKSSVRSGRGGSGQRRMGLPDILKVKIPRQVAGRITWDRFIVFGTFNTSTTLAMLRQDYVTQSQDPNSASYLAIFDSFCIFKAVWSYTSLEAPGQSGTLPVTFLVREFNSNSGSTTTALQGYQSCQERALAPGKSNVMTVMPEYGFTVGSTATGANGRGWLNAANASNVPWYGTLFGVNATTTSAVMMSYKVEVWIGYANGD